MARTKVELNFNDFSNFPVVGELWILYIDNWADIIYRWNWSNYIPISWVSILGTWKWTYNAWTTYESGDLVYYNGSTYICIAETTWNLPTNTSYWNISVSKGETGASIVSWEFVWDDLVFTKDDTNTVTITDAKIDLKWDQWIQWIQWVKWDKGDTWATWNWIASIDLTDWDHSPWTLDTYTITYTDTTTDTFQVYNWDDWAWVTWWDSITDTSWTWLTTTVANSADAWTIAQSIVIW
jgi:hypothetical protein